MTKPESARKALSTMQVAERCGVHYTTVRRWVLEGNLPAYETPGGHLRVLREDVDAFLESRKLRGKVNLSGTLRVLVVDDDRTFRESAVEFLGREPNMEVREAADGFVAGRLVSEFQPHVVILDLLMPGVDGFEVCRNIKHSPRSRQTRVLVLTGYPTGENIRKARENGADLCMAKPVGLEKLRDTILGLAHGTLGEADKAKPSDGAPPQQ